MFLAKVGLNPNSNSITNAPKAVNTYHNPKSEPESPTTKKGSNKKLLAIDIMVPA